MLTLETLVLQAEERIRPYIRETILEPSLALGDKHDVFLKLENLQHTGSFKFRGAMNKLLSLSDAQRDRGVITASTGNHGAAVALGLKILGIKGMVCVPENASEAKLKNIRQLGAEIKLHGDDGVVAENYARQFATDHGLTYISPYNDPDVIAGQGTIAAELERQLEHIDAVFVALGGGGLISGISSYLKTIHPHAKIIGCSPENSAVMIESLNADKILDLDSKPTLSDGTAGGVEVGAITFELCQQLVDDTVTVAEDEIKQAMRLIMETQHQLIEGAAGVAVASYLKTKEQLDAKNVVIIICGANISLEDLRTVLS